MSKTDQELIKEIEKQRENPIENAKFLRKQYIGQKQDAEKSFNQIKEESNKKAKEKLGINPVKRIEALGKNIKNINEIIVKKEEVDETGPKAALRNDVRKYMEKNPEESAALIRKARIGRAVAIGAAAAAVPMFIVNPVGSIALVGVAAGGLEVSRRAANELINEGKDFETKQHIKNLDNRIKEFDKLINNLEKERTVNKEFDQLIKQHEQEMDKLAINTSQQQSEIKKVRKNFQEFRDKYVPRERSNIVNQAYESDKGIKVDYFQKPQKTKSNAEKTDDKNLNSTKENSKLPELREKYQVDQKPKKRGMNI